EPLTLVRRHREHYGKPISSIQDSMRALEKATRLGIAADFKSTVRKQRAKMSALLARSYVVSGNLKGALSALISAAPYSWRYANWWFGAAQALAWALAPDAIRGIVREYRSNG